MCELLGRRLRESRHLAHKQLSGWFLPPSRHLSVRSKSTWEDGLTFVGVNVFISVVKSLDFDSLQQRLINI